MDPITKNIYICVLGFHCKAKDLRICCYPNNAHVIMPQSRNPDNPIDLQEYLLK